MCGIVGYSGKKEAVPVLLSGLAKLEYRGYDSAGIAVISKNKLFIRKTPDGKTKFSFSNGPGDMPLSEMCKASVMRWPIEQCFEEGKGQLGMDHYEHRSWPAWHRHMIYVFLGLHFLLRLRMKLKKNSGSYSAPSTEVGCGSLASPYANG